MEFTNQSKTIKILAYVAVNEIQHLTDDNQQISRYIRSFRYEHQDALQSRRMAFTKLLDERAARLFGNDIEPEQRFSGLSMYMEYLEKVENSEPNTWELKKLNLLTGKPMTTEEQAKRWQNELRLLKKANPDIEYPVISMETGDSVYEILEVPYWTLMYYFYE